MRVKNGKCIRKLSIKTLWAQRRRNLIAIIAIVLTSLLFTSLFTVVLSINASYQTYQFRQLGGYAHGTFKEVTERQASDIGGHRLVRETGLRINIGAIMDGVFAKVPAELSYMDENCASWSYAVPTTGRMAVTGNEITMDTKALEKLGVEPRLGAEVTLTYTLQDKTQSGPTVTDTFILVGWWDYDGLMPVHYINVSYDYAKHAEALGAAAGMEPFRADLNVMMASSVDIRGQMERVDTDLGYTWEDRFADNAVRIGVNWGYTTSQLADSPDMETVAAIAAFLVLVAFTGYLIIYNIFQISVAGDIRYYGLLKTIGVTARQLRCIVRIQALALCVAGIPIGLLLGYGVGALLTPAIIDSSSLGASAMTVSASPLIFVISALFAFGTVLLSCAKPGRQAGRVSPVEATRYTEAQSMKKKRSVTRGAKVSWMAFANLGQNRSKTALVVISLALSVVLLNVLVQFVGGFDVEKYLSATTSADFIVSSPDYFRHPGGVQEYLPEDALAELRANTEAALSGCGYMRNTGITQAWMPTGAWRMEVAHFYGTEQAEDLLSAREQRGGTVREYIQVEGLDAALLDKLDVLDGDLAPLLDPEGHSIAVAVNLDDYGNLEIPEYYPAIGDTLTLVYADEGDVYYIDRRTGELSDDDTPMEYIQQVVSGGREVEYTVCALVVVPHSMSFRYSTMGYQTVLPVDALERDSGEKPLRMFYLFDTPDETAEVEAERYLAELTSDAFSPLMYESKTTARAEFEGFQKLFLLLGGVLCAIIGLVGILNFFNAVMTGILSRRWEFAVLQAVGMTNRQLRSMLILEGLFYALGAAALALVLSVPLSPLTGRALERMFWFYSPHITMLPVLASIPAFALLGWLIPTILYRQAAKQSVVERLREVA